MDNLMDLIFGIVYNDHDSDLIGRDQDSIYSRTRYLFRRFIVRN